MNQIESLKIAAILLATFPGARVEPPAVDPTTKRPIPNTGTAAAYARLLADLDPAVAAAAIERVAATWRYANLLPTVAEIREAAVSLSVGEVQPGGAAFGAVVGLMRSTREHRGYHAADPPPQSVVEKFAGVIAWQALQAIGGWRAICCADEGDPAPRSQFVRAYDALAVNERRAAVSHALPAVAKYLALRGDEARQAALPEGTSDEERRGADAWSLPTKAGAHAGKLLAKLTGGAS